MTISLYLLRHGKTELPGRYVGSTDVNLSLVGEQQVKAVRPLIAEEKIDHVICSPMKRCQQTLDLLELPHKRTIDSAIKEIDFGLWEGKNFNQISESHPDLVNLWAKGQSDFSFPEGESMQNFMDRLEKFKKELSSYKKANILLVTHGGVIRYLICSYLGLTFDKYILFRILEGTYTKLDLYDQGGILSGLNIGINKSWQN